MSCLLLSLPHLQGVWNRIESTRTGNTTAIAAHDLYKVCVRLDLWPKLDLSYDLAVDTVDAHDFILASIVYTGEYALCNSAGYSKVSAVIDGLTYIIVFIILRHIRHIYALCNKY